MDISTLLSNFDDSKPVEATTTSPSSSLSPKNSPLGHDLASFMQSEPMTPSVHKPTKLEEMLSSHKEFVKSRETHASLLLSISPADISPVEFRSVETDVDEDDWRFHEEASHDPQDDNEAEFIDIRAVRDEPYDPVDDGASDSGESIVEVKRAETPKRKREESASSPKKHKTSVSWTFESAANTFRGGCKLRNVYRNVHPSFVPEFDHVQLTSRNGEVITIERDIRRITCKVKGKPIPGQRFEYQFAKPKGKSELSNLKRAAHAIAKQKLKGKTFDTPAEAAMASDQAMRFYASALKKIAKENPTFRSELNDEATGKLQQIHFPTVNEVQHHGEEFFKTENLASIHLKRNGKHMKTKSSCDQGGCNLGCLQASCAIKDLKRDLWVHSHTAKGPKTVVPHYCYKTDLEQFLLNEKWLLIEIVKNENGEAERGEVVPFSIHGSSQHLTVLGEGSVCATFGKWNLVSSRKQLTIQRQYRPVRADGTKKTTKWVPDNGKKKTKCIPKIKPATRGRKRKSRSPRQGKPQKRKRRTLRDVEDMKKFLQEHDWKICTEDPDDIQEMYIQTLEELAAQNCDS